MPRLWKPTTSGNVLSHSALVATRRGFQVMRLSLAAAPTDPSGNAAITLNSGLPWVTRDGRPSRRRACVPWHGGETEPLARSWSSCENEIRASLTGDDGWVGMCASASKTALLISTKLNRANLKYIGQPARLATCGYLEEWPCIRCLGRYSYFYLAYLQLVGVSWYYLDSKNAYT